MDWNFTKPSKYKLFVQTKKYVVHPINPKRTVGNCTETEKNSFYQRIQSWTVNKPWVYEIKDMEHFPLYLAANSVNLAYRPGFIAAELGLLFLGLTAGRWSDLELYFRLRCRITITFFKPITQLIYTHHAVTLPQNWYFLAIIKQI